MSPYLSLVMSPPLHISQVVYGQISTRTDYYKYSFYPFTVVQWNYLVATLTDLDGFKRAVSQVFHSKP